MTDRVAASMAVVAILGAAAVYVAVDSRLNDATTEAASLRARVTSLEESGSSASAASKVLESADGRKAVADTVESIQEEKDRERYSKVVAERLAGFAKKASLTDDQTTQMHDILSKSADQTWAVF